MRHTLADYHLLDSRRDPAAALPGAHAAEHLEAGRKAALCCVACCARITDASSRIEVAGRHEHTFFNPAGQIFQVAAFAAAPGCRGLGAFTSEFSWFPGHRWQVALCAVCAEQLGWHFAGASHFTLLIVPRLRDCPAGENA